MSDSSSGLAGEKITLRRDYGLSDRLHETRRDFSLWRREQARRWMLFRIRHPSFDALLNILAFIVIMAIFGSVFMFWGIAGSPEYGPPNL